MDYFSDREQKQKPSTEVINNTVWFGIVASIQKCIRDDSLSKDFPKDCPDGRGVCGFDEDLFRSSLKAIIPDMDYPFPSIGVENSFEDEEENRIRSQKEQYAVLDTIEFVYHHLHDVVKDPKRFHEFFGHYDLLFVDGDLAKGEFRESINTVLCRNGILFQLTESGEIIRVLPPGASEAISAIPDLKEETIRDLISVAVLKYQAPKFEECRIGLERLWDAFERIKTAYRPDLDKRDSAAELLLAISSGNEPFRQRLETECRCLTEFGNQFQIRHHEVDKIPIANKDMLDYLFLRMLSMINLLLSVFPK